AGASIRGPIGIVFDAPIDPASIADSLRITPSVAGSISVSSLPDDSTPITAPISSPSAPIGRVLLFTPSGQLAPHTTYTVSLSATVRRLDDPGQVAAARTWAFTTGQATSSAQNQVAFLSARAGVRNLWLMNPDGSNPRQITSELVPLSGYDVSPDGGTIAYSAGGLVHVVRVDGSDARTVTTSGHWDYSPTFSPDARSVLVARVADGTGPVASDGRGGLALLAGSGPGGSVDPLRMAFLAPGGTAPLSLTSGAGPADRWPAFAPNGDLILFLRVSTSAPDRSEGIRVIQPDGRQLRQRSTDGSYPRWPP